METFTYMIEKTFQVYYTRVFVLRSLSCVVAPSVARNFDMAWKNGFAEFKQIYESNLDSDSEEVSDDGDVFIMT